MKQIANGFVKLSYCSSRGGYTYFSYFSRKEAFAALKAIQGPALESIRNELSGAQRDLSDYLPNALPFAALRMAGFSVKASAEMMKDLSWEWESAVNNLVVAGYRVDDAMSAVWDVYRDVIGAAIIMKMFSSVFTGSLFLDLAR